MTGRFLVDTNVLLYARGGDHPQRDPCRQILHAAASGSVRLEASVELVQEFCHVLLRRGGTRSSVLDEVDEVAALVRLHPFDEDVLATMRALLASNGDLGVRDAVHAATAMHVGADALVSTDRAFDAVEGVTRLDPSASHAPWARG